MPKVSIVILNWNGKKFLKICLPTLRKITYKKVEIIVVDNGSTDGSQAYVARYFEEITLIRNRENRGFAGGNNIGYLRAKGEYILFLNNDTAVTPSFLEPLVRVLDEDSSVSCVQPQMRILADMNTIDEVGAFLTPTGFMYHFGYHKPYTNPKYQHMREVFSAKGACMLVRRETLDQVGGFDEDFFIFFEETDLCFRMWLYGYKVLYIPSSVIYHAVGGDTTKSDSYDRARRIYLTFQNMNYSYLKNFGIRNFFIIYLPFIVLQIGLLMYFVMTGQGSIAKALVSAWGWNIRNVRKILKKRKVIQRRRTLDDTQVNAHILYNPRLSYYYWLLFDAKRYNDFS